MKMLNTVECFNYAYRIIEERRVRYTTDDMRKELYQNYASSFFFTRAPGIARMGFVRSSANDFYEISEMVGDRYSKRVKMGTQWRRYTNGDLIFIYHGQENDMLSSLDDYIQEISLPEMKVIKT